MPSQKLDKALTASTPDWTPLFRAAELDPATLRPDAPLWYFLEASDTRAAWTGTWPGSTRPLRVEAAALGGKPVVFTLIGPWAGASRMPTAGGTEVKLVVLALIALAVLVASIWLARDNLRRNRGDRRGASRLGILMFCVLFLLWLARLHPVGGVGLLGLFLVEVATATFFAVLVWTIYLGFEPFVRRFWPQTLIAWTRILSGRFQDGIVGRDILAGAALSCLWRIMVDMLRLWRPGQMPQMASEDLLIGVRGAFREQLENVPHAIEFTLVLFFAIFLLRVMLRREWLAAAAFTLLFVAVAAWSGSSTADLVFTAIIYGSYALLTIRFGLLALATLSIFDGILGDMPATFDASAWFYPYFAVTLVLLAGIVLWAFRQSIRRGSRTA